MNKKKSKGANDGLSSAFSNKQTPVGAVEKKVGFEVLEPTAIRSE